MVCQVVNSQSQLQTRLPALPANLPTTQAEWNNVTNILQRWGQALQQQTHAPNVIPSQFQTFSTASASAVLAALTSSNCTPSIGGAGVYGANTLELNSLTNPATVGFAGTPIAIAAATRWFCAFQIFAASGATGSLTVKTSSGATVTESFTVPASGSPQQLWALVDLSANSDTQATWTFTFTSTAAVALDGLQMNAVDKTLAFLPKFAGTAMILSAGAYASNLDGIPDGSTYARSLSSGLTSGQVNRGGIAVPFQGGQNLLFNPTGRFGLQGWTPSVGGVFSSQNNGAGFTSRIGAGTSTAANLEQTITPTVSGQNYTLSGWTEIGPGSGGTIGVEIVDKTSSTILASSYVGGYWHLTVNFPNTTDTFVVRLKWAPGTQVYAFWYQLKFEYGPTATPFSDDWATALVGSSHNPSGGTGLDAILDGGTYARPLASHLSSGVAYNFQGAWASATAYVIGDEVTYSNGYWLCKVANTNSAPTQSNANWTFVAPISADANNRALIDFSQAGHVNKSLANVPDGSGRYAVVNAGSLKGVASVDSANLALIDFSQTGHTNKNLTNIPDGSARFAVVNASGMKGVAAIDANNKALIDFTQSGHTGKSLANIPDDATSARYAVEAIDGNRKALIDFVQAHTNPACYWTSSILAPTNATCSGNSVCKSGGVNGTWDTAAYTSVGFPTAYVAGYIRSTSDDAMLGLSANPTASVSYTSLNYAWQNAVGTWEIWESGTQVVANAGTAKVSDRVAITYDGTTVRYYLNGVVVRSVASSLSKVYGFAALAFSLSSWINLEFGPGGTLAQISPQSGHLMPTGSIPPAVSNPGIGYSSTTTSLTLSWSAFTLYRMDGTTTSISANAGFAVSGLTANTTYTFYPYVAEGSTTMSFATGFSGSSGSPACAYASGSATAAAEAYNQSNIPLLSFQLSTPASGTGGGGGDSRGCLHPVSLVELADGRHIFAADLVVGDMLPSPTGPVPIARIMRKPRQEWCRVRFGQDAMTVTMDHRFLLPDHGEVRAQDLRLGTIVAGRDRHLEVTGLYLLREAAEMVSIELHAPHLYYVGGALSHNPKP